MYSFANFCIVLARAGEPANFFSAPAPCFFSSISGSFVFFQAAPAPHFFSASPAMAPWGQTNVAPCDSCSGSGSYVFVKFGEIFFPLKLLSKTARNIKQVKQLYF